MSKQVVNPLTIKWLIGHDIDADPFLAQRYNTFAKRPGSGNFGRYEDAWNIIDIISCQPGRGIVMIQACGPSDLKAHVHKMCVEFAETTIRLLLSGAIVELWQWRKVCAIKKDGKKSKRKVWQPKIYPVTLEGCREVKFKGEYIAAIS